MLRLLATDGHEEQVFALPESEARLGSATDNSIVLRATGVSRHHAIVRRSPGGLEFVDLGSKNGLCVEGQRVRRAMLTPGLRLQIGAAWLEVEEVSSSEAALAVLSQGASGQSASPPLATVTAEPESDRQGLSPDQAALALAYHIAQRGAGFPCRRTDLLARIKATLGAELFVSFERRPGGSLRILEAEGELAPKDAKRLASLARKARSSPRGQVILRRSERLLLAGRDSWFLGAKFAEESFARESWRKELLRFLAHRFFLPLRSLDELEASEAHRVLALAGGNKSRTARLLRVARGTLDKILSRRS